jgi:acetyl esterase
VGDFRGNLRNPATDIQDPELSPLIREMNPLGGVAPFTTEEKRKAYRDAVSRSGAPEPIRSVEDELISSRDAEIRARVYRPSEDRNLPIALYLHGGGFLSGDLDTHDPVCRMIANHVPAIVVAAEYRLAPEFLFPTAAEDCFSAMRWVATNGREFGGDIEKLLVIGDSAGGNLAAVTALMARDRGLNGIAAQVLIYPMLDATLSSPSLIENAHMPPFMLVDCVHCWQSYLGPETNRQNPYVSPLCADNLTGLPRALVITAEFDILSDEGQLYADRLEEAGVPVEREHFPNMIHGFFQWGGQVAAARLAMNRVVQFLKSV